jgi:2-keto-4-pentenoate hydratase/2-oxohepta-3-ene-1,7-dioic acid hydratase in catechol pathway
MRLLTYRNDGERRLGVLRGGSEVVDLGRLAGALGAPAPPAGMLELIDAGEGGLAAVRELLEGWERTPSAAAAPVVQPLAEVTLLAPLDPPRGNVLAIGRNYEKHAQEGARVSGGEVQPPTIFTKAITSIAGPADGFPFDAAVSEQIDWEVELGLVIGSAGVNIARADALDHVFGYLVMNDITARDIQRGWGGQFFKGKSLDGSCPSGPWIVTRDEIPDPQRLELRLRVNGVVKQEASTADMIYPVDALIEWLSLGMTLLPGMLVATGTPEGVGFARQPPEFLKPGDLVEAEVEGIGTLRTPVAAVPAVNRVR